MSGIDKLQLRILQDAEKHADRIIADAKRRADDIIKSAKDEAEKIKEDSSKKVEVESKRLKDRLIAMAELELRKKRLAAKQQVIDQAFNDAMKKMNDLSAQEYKDILIKMILGSVSSGDEEIILSERDFKRYGLSLAEEINEKLSKKGIKPGLTVSKDYGSFTGGFILRRDKVEINNSFEAIFKMMRSRLEVEVVKILFA